MAQAGYTPISLYYSTTASAAPTAGNLVSGELAININDGKLYYKDSGGVVQLIASKAGASGDVVGPASATDNAVVRYDGTTGKLVQNSAVTIADTTGDITGGAYNKVTITAPATSATLTIANGKTLTANNSLTLAGTDATVMTFPATSTTVAGLSIAQTFTADQAITGNLTLNAQGDVRFADSDSSNWVAFQGPATVATNVTWTLPSADGSNGQVLTTNGTGTLSWTSNAGGDVTGPASATDNAVPTFDGTTGKLIKNNSGVTIVSGTVTASGFSGPLNGTVGATTPSTGVFTQVDITAQGDLRLQDTTGGEYVAIQAPGTLASSYTLTLPVDDGTSGQVLTTNGSGVLSWANDAGGDVTGPASSTDNAVARFDGTTGKIIQNSAVTIADTTGNIIGGSYNRVTITAPATGSTLTIADGKTLTANNSLTLSGTDATTMTFPSTSQTIAGLGLAQTFTAAQTFRAASSVRAEAAATQDAVVLAGRAGGTSSFAVTLTPTTLGANRTLTLPDVSSTVAVLGLAQTFTADQTITGNLTLNAQGDVRFADSDSSNWVAFQGPATVGTNITWTLPSADGSNGQVLTTNGTGTLSWTTAATNITISNDTSTASDLYPTFLSSTTGTASTINTSNAKLLYRPSTGELKASVPVASNGIFVNNTTVADSYTIGTGSNGMSIGPITVNSGITVTVSSGQRWLVL